MIRATSTPGQGGHSELRFEAQAGRELVYLGSRRDLGIGVGQDKTETVAQHEMLKVGGDRERRVLGCETVGVGADQAIGVGGARAVTVGANETIAVGGSQDIGVRGDRSITVDGKATEIVGEHLSLRVGGDKTEKIVGSSRESVDAERTIEARSQSIDVREDMRTRVGGTNDEHAEKVNRMSAGELVELVCGEATITAHKDGSITLVGKNVHVKVAGAIEVEGDKLTVKSQGAVNVQAGGAVKLRGRGVNLN